MSENIGKRVARLISGSINALVDAVENSSPEMVMEQAMREIDSALDETRAELGQQVTQKHLASKKLMEENSRYEILSAQLEVAITNSRDDLAEAGIAEQMDIEARMLVLESAIAEGSAREKELEGFIQALQAKKREMKAELAAYVKARATQPTGGGFSGGTKTESAERKAERAGDAFGRVMEKASGVPGRVTETGNARKLAELEDHVRKNRIAERLAALKAGKA
jgi:phage shock protein A